MYLSFSRSSFSFPLCLEENIYISQSTHRHYYILQCFISKMIERLTDPEKIGELHSFYHNRSQVTWVQMGLEITVWRLFLFVRFDCTYFIDISDEKDNRKRNYLWQFATVCSLFFLIGMSMLIIIRIILAFIIMLNIIIITINFY